MLNKTIRSSRHYASTSSPKSLWLIPLLLISPVILYYLWTRGVIYLNFSKEVYTDYFWYRAPWLLLHVVCGLIATLIGPFQFIPQIRAANPSLHRNLGKVYLGCIALSTAVSFYLVSTAQLGIVYAVGLAMLGIVWFTTTFLAYFFIRRKNIQLHKEWMIKSYVLTLAFISFRSVEDLLATMNISTFVDRKVLMAWCCWTIPFFITEVVLQIIRPSK